MKSTLKILALLAISMFFSFTITAQVDFYFTSQNGWQMDRHIRTMGDINGDGKADIVGFGEKGVFVSFSDGKNFSVPQMLISNFAIGAGMWSVDKHSRLVADANGDGKDDIIGIGAGGVLVALSKGKSFGPIQTWLNHGFTPNNGWSNQRHVRLAADVNGDQKADIVGFGEKGVYVAFSDGYNFGSLEMIGNIFAIGAGGWQVDKHTRLVTDINNDQKADIIGFGGQVFIALSEGKKFGAMTGIKQKFYTNPSWWNLKRHRRMMGDVNGDGQKDIIGFTESKLYISLSKGENFEPQRMCFERFVFGSGWSPEKYPISVADINGDGKDDIIGFKDNRVYVAYANGTCFDEPFAVSFR